MYSKLRLYCLASFLVFAIGITSQLATAQEKEASADAVFKSKCASCHGADGSGNTKTGKALKVPDLKSPEVQKKTDAELYDVIAKGKGKMQGYEKTLGEATAHRLVQYMRELGKSSGQKTGK